jgi:cell division protein FtsI (penicillin-binding protein 3)
MKMTELHIEGVGRKTMEVAYSRVMWPIVFFAVGFMLLTVKLVSLSLFQTIKTSKFNGVITAKPAEGARADITDRNGVILATNLESMSLSVNPKLVEKPELMARQISAIIPDESYQKILKKLTSSGNHEWLKRKLSPKQIWAINSLGHPSLTMKEAQKRTYPHGSIFSHILGYVGVDNQPFAGVEKYFQERLTGVEELDQPLTLSVDTRVQHILHRELYSSMKKFSAIGAAGIIMDVNTGEVIAMASLPDFDPNIVKNSRGKGMFNRLTGGVYEMGSGFKAFTVAMALDMGVVKMTDGYDATHPLKIDRFTISDDHPKARWLNVPEIFTFSSNIATAMMIHDVGRDRQKAFLKRLGMLEKANIELTGLARPILPRFWGEVESTTIAYGHGIAVSPVHLVTGVAAMVNGGRLISATLIKQKEYYKEKADKTPAPSFVKASYVEEVSDKKSSRAGYKAERIISEKTSEEMRDLFRLVVEKGTGSKAQVEGYGVGGKTGTAEKPGKGGYRKKDLISSFVGVFPIDKPRYVIFVMLDEPRGIKETFNFASGGWTAAPTVSKIISQIGPLLNIMPSEKKKLKYEDYIMVSKH